MIYDNLYEVGVDYYNSSPDNPDNQMDDQEAILLDNEKDRQVIEYLERRYDAES